MTRLLKLSVLLLLGMCAGCAFIRNIPANSTPAREARYYRTQDLGSCAIGFSADRLLGYVIKGPDAKRDSPWPLVLRMTIIGGGAFAWRQTDRGYRESGAMMIGLCANASNLLRIAKLALKR